MSMWNYRYLYDTQRKRLMIAEVYYDDDGIPVFCTSDPVELEGFDYNDDEQLECKLKDLDLLIKRINKDLKKNPSIIFYPKAFIGNIDTDSE